MEKLFVRDMLQADVLKNYDAFGHCCNCFNTMGAGIAKHVADKFPELYQADQATIKGDMEKLGYFTKATILRNEYSIVGYNLYGQYDYNRYKATIDYDALRLSLSALNDELVNRRLIVPAMGTGLAGGSIELLERIIIEAMPDVRTTICLLKT